MSNTSDLNLLDPYHPQGQPLRFWFFLVGDVFGILASIFALYHLLVERTSRQALHNHGTILILLFNFIYQLVDIPLHLQYFSTGMVYPSTPALCLVWWFIDYSFFFIVLVLILWISIERHILIFHASMLATQGKRILVHYLPLCLIVFSMLLFYIVAIFAPPCENKYDYTSNLCGMSGCYGSIPSLAMIERVGFSIAPSFLIAFVNLALLARIIWQKSRFRRTVEWRRQRKLTIHIISLSFLYLCFDFPLSVIIMVRLCGVQHWANDILPTFFFYSYLPVLFLPIVCIGSLSELRHKVQNLDPRKRRVTTHTAQT